MGAVFNYTTLGLVNLKRISSSDDLLLTTFTWLSSLHFVLGQRTSAIIV